MNNKKPIISKNSRIRYGCKVGDYSIIDDYCYISTQVNIGRFFHIANNVSIIGGKDSWFIAGDFGSLSAGVRILCGNDNFGEDFSTVLQKQYEIIKTNVDKGVIKLGDCVTIGANTVVMPHNQIPEGVCIGAMSFVPSEFEFKSWSIYAGCPKLRFIKKRNQEKVFKQMELIKYYER